MAIFGCRGYDKYLKTDKLCQWPRYLMSSRGSPAIDIKVAPPLPNESIPTSFFNPVFLYQFSSIDNAGPWLTLTSFPLSILQKIRFSNPADTYSSHSI